MKHLFHRPATSIRRIFIPSLLSCVLCPAPPVGTHSLLQLPCCNNTSTLRPEGRWQLSPDFVWSYLEHSHPIAAFESPVDYLTGTGIPLPAATFVARLVVNFTCRVTLVGVKNSRLHQVCPRLPPRHSFQFRLLGLISGDRIQKLLPYPF